MLTANPPAGQVTVEAVWLSGRLQRIAVAARRPAAARLFAGKTAPQVRALVPRLFTLCGQAQGAVAAAALAVAAGLPPPAEAAGALQREAIGEHLWRLLLDWPERLAAGEGDEDSLRSSLKEDFRWSQKKAANATFAALYRRLRGSESDAVLRDALSDWLAANPVLPLLDALAPWDARVEAARPRSLPAVDASTLGPLYAGADAGFAERPECFGQAVEVGAFADWQGASPVLELVAAGRPLAARLLARRLALEAAVAELAELAEPAAGIASFSPRPGQACAWTMTARGPLCHRVELDAGVVVDYQLIAPTEWNFHPDSAWLDHLRGARAETPEIAENLLRLWTLALDPCVPLALTLNKED